MDGRAFEKLKALLPGVCMVDVIVHKPENGTAAAAAAEVVSFPLHILITQSKVIATLLGYNDDWNGQEGQKKKVLDMTGFCNDSTVNKKCMMLMLLVHQEQCAELQLWAFKMQSMFPTTELSKQFVPDLELDTYANSGSQIGQMMRTCMYYRSDSACEKVDEIATLYMEDMISKDRCTGDAPDTVTFVVHAEKDFEPNPFSWSEVILERMYLEISKAKKAGDLIEPCCSLMRFMAKDTMLKVLSYAPPFSNGFVYESDGFFGF